MHVSAYSYTKFVSSYMSIHAILALGPLSETILKLIIVYIAANVEKYD